MKLLVVFLVVVCFNGLTFGQTCSCNGPVCASCGNGVCDTNQGENCNSCPRDCGSCPGCVYCGNGICDSGETSCSCPGDCGSCCVDGVCQGSETFSNCPLDCGGSASGYVYDAMTGLPLPYDPNNSSMITNLTCVGTQTSTIGNSPVDTDGSFAVGGLQPGYYACSASLTGYYTNSQAIQVVSYGQSNTLNSTFRISLTKMSGCITGRTMASGVYLSSVNVTCTQSSMGWQANRISDSSMGTYFFQNTPAGVYTCVANKLGYQNAMGTVTASDGQCANLDLNLAPLNGTITGILTDRDTLLPVVGANITCATCNNVTWGSSLSAADGSFIVTGVPMGDYTCSVSKATYVSSVFRGCSVIVGDVISKGLTLRQIPAMIVGTVVDATTNSTMVPGASVTCLSIWQSVTGASNAAPYQIASLIPADFICSASATGYTGESLSQTVLSGQIATLTFSLIPQPGSIMGTVASNSGAAVTNATITCIGNGNTLSGTTTALGDFLITNSPDGTYMCTALNNGTYSATNSVVVTKGTSAKVSLQFY